jgi:hypothetical protein
MINFKMFKYLDSLFHNKEEALIVLQQVVDVGQTSQQQLLVLVFGIMQ